MRDGAYIPIWPFMHPYLPWILAALSVCLLTAAAALWLFSQRKPKRKPLPTEWTLSPRPVFSVDERRVYRQLREALPHHIVLSKLPLVRFCQPVDPQEVRYWYELLGGVHVTFAICSANGRVLAAVDLEQDRHNSRRAAHIKQSVLTACKVRYLRCSADRLPSVPELQLLVPQTSGLARGPQAVPAPVQAASSATLAARRRERATLWQDSGFLQDSFFGTDGHSDFGVPSSFNGLRSGVSVRELSGQLPFDIGGVVTDTPRAQVRH